MHLAGTNIEEDVAHAIAELAQRIAPRIVLAGSTAWGREVASRLAARLDAGLVGDAVELDCNDDGTLTAWKPAFGGQLVAAVGLSLGLRDRNRARRRARRPARLGRAATEIEVEQIALPQSQSRRRARPHARRRPRRAGRSAHRHRSRTGRRARRLRRSSNRCATVLHAELGATRKVTDKGWLPRSRQIGITGRAIAPRLFVSIGASGKFNHSVGIRAAGRCSRSTPNADAPILEHADTGIVGDWQEVLPLPGRGCAARRRWADGRPPEHGEQRRGAADADDQGDDRSPTNGSAQKPILLSSDH